MSLRSTPRRFLSSCVSLFSRFPARGLLTSFMLLLIGQVVRAQPSTAVDFLAASLGDLCHGIQDLIPTTAMMLVMFAAVIYASGQFFGAETRARANVWATSCITGAIIGIIISTIAPDILSQLAGQTVSC